MTRLPPWPVLGLKAEADAGTATLAVAGELDLYTSTMLRDALRRLERTHPSLLVVDLRELTHIDATGLRLLASAHRRAQGDGRRLVVVKAGPLLHRFFELTALDKLLELVDEPPDD
jgi:anti-sigma B factor antagonist